MYDRLQDCCVCCVYILYYIQYYNTYTVVKIKIQLRKPLKYIIHIKKFFFYFFIV